MSLEQIGQKIKSLTAQVDLFKIGQYFSLILVVVNVYVWLAIVHLKNPEPIKVVDGLKLDFESALASNSSSTQNTPKGSIVASKNGTKYYFLHCSGVKRIKNENKIYFMTAEEAKKAGFSIASGCKE